MKKSFGEHDSLVSMSPEQVDPYKAKGSDFPSISSGTEAGGKDTIDACVTSPRSCEDSGMGSSGAGTPVPEDRAAVVSGSFKVGQAKEKSSSVSISDNVDLTTGKVNFSQYKNQLP